MPTPPDPLKPCPSLGVWFQSSVSGLWYQNHEAAGDISSISIEGVLFTRPIEDDLRRKLEVCKKALEIYALSHSPEWRLNDNGETAQTALDAVKEKL